MNLRERLLPLTIKNAAALPFYRRHWCLDAPPAAQTVEDLGALPTLTKRTYRNSYMNDFDHTDSHFVTHSTGTTGELTYRHRSREEALFIERLLQRPAESPDAAPEVGIVLRNAFHGMTMPIPGRGVSVPASARNPVQRRQCIQMLQHPFRVHGSTVPVTWLTGQAADIAVLAESLYAEEVDPAALPLRGLTLLGAVDQCLRSYLRSAFAVDVDERFSSSEIFGGATRRTGSDFFETDPYVVAEVTDATGLPVAPGEIGQLTWTELHPFVQMQPLIRYLTGDVVELVEETSPGQIRFRWLGRSAQCATVAGTGGDDITLGFLPLADAVGDLPTVVRPIDADQHSNRFGDVGLPAIELSGDDPRSVVVRVRIAFEPRFHRGATHQIVERIWSYLAAAGADVTATIELHSGTGWAGPPFEGSGRPRLRIGPARSTADPPAV